MPNTLTKNIETFLGCDSEYESTGAALLGTPFGSTTPFCPGTCFASRAMWDDPSGLKTYSPYQDKDLTDISVFDGDDLKLCFGDTQEALAQVEEFAAGILEDDKLPVMVGDEYPMALGAVRAMVKKHSDLHILHFDAHADLREKYLGATLSRATMLHRCQDLVGDGKISQFDIHSGDRSEFLWGRQHVSTRKFNFEGLEKAITSLEGEPIYVTIDLGILDPSVFPDAGAPEPSGINLLQLLHATLALKGLNAVDCDMNELSPVYDQSSVSTAVACKILWELLLILVPASDEKRRDRINRS